MRSLFGGVLFSQWTNEVLIVECYVCYHTLKAFLIAFAFVTLTFIYNSLTPVFNEMSTLTTNTQMYEFLGRNRNTLLVLVQELLSCNS